VPLSPLGDAMRTSRGRRRYDLGCGDARARRCRFRVSPADQGRTGSARQGTNRIREIHGAGAEYA
jgi:hypothetical protein